MATLTCLLGVHVIHVLCIRDELDRRNRTDQRSALAGVEKDVGKS